MTVLSSQGVHIFTLHFLALLFYGIFISGVRLPTSPTWQNFLNYYNRTLALLPPPFK